MIFGMTYYQIAMYFLVYSFGGWCLEVIYHALKVGKIINRGFLNGPVCPVYGFGMLAVCAMLHFLPKDQGTGDTNTLAVFVGGMILATAVEFVAGYLLYHLFHARWWDYSKMPLNIGGYICPLFSILWGLACVLVVKFIHPLVENSANNLIPERIGWPIMGVLYLLYLIDLIVTILTVTGMNKELDELDKIRALMRKPSDKMSEVIGSSTMQAAQKVDESRVQAALGKAEMQESTRAARLAAGEAVLHTKEEAEKQKALHKKHMEEKTEGLRARKEAQEQRLELSMEEAAQKKEEYQKRYEELREDLLEHPHFGKTRLLKAFPEMKHASHDELVQELQKMLKG